MLIVTEIPEAEWKTLRSALVQAALITVERVHVLIAALFIRFHPVLAPFLRSQLGANDTALYQRYAQRYSALARFMHVKDISNPQPVRAMVRSELPNFKRSLRILVEIGAHNAAMMEMAGIIAQFLNYFGLHHERDELWKLVNVALRNHDSLTRMEWLHEAHMGQAELGSNNIQAAHDRFTRLLRRIEEQPKGVPQGRGSIEHAQTLNLLADCLAEGGQVAVAEDRLREALGIFEALIKEEPDNQTFIHQRGSLLGNLGDMLDDQGQYNQARILYETALEVARNNDDERSQSLAIERLGKLALHQGDYDEASKRYKAALEIARYLGEPVMEAKMLNQLGVIAQEQHKLEEAEQYYRQSVEIKVRFGDLESAAGTYNNLARIAQSAGRLADAEGWYRRAIELLTRTGPPVELARKVNNLAQMLTEEALAGNMARLPEARKFAEQALAIKETLDVASGSPWNTLKALAQIAELEGRVDDARVYRRRERETFAMFVGNRWDIEQKNGHPIALIAAAAQGNTQARAVMEQEFPKMEEQTGDWSKMPLVIRRIWAGEREWHALAEELDAELSLFVLRVLERLEPIVQNQEPESESQEQLSVEEMIAAMPEPILAAIKSGDRPAFVAALFAMKAEERQRVGGVLQMAELLNTFFAVPDSNALAEFWQQVPLELKDTFLAAVEAQIAQLVQAGDVELSTALRQRLDGVRQLRARQAAAVERRVSVTQSVIDFLDARSLEDLPRFVAEHPQLLSDAVEPVFATLREQFAGHQDALAAIESRRAVLQAFREQGVEPVIAQLRRASEQALSQARGSAPDEAQEHD